MLSSDLFFVFKWWGLIFLLGASFLPLTYKVFNSFRDKGYIFSKILAILIVSYTVFVISFLHLSKFGQVSSIIIWVIIAIICNFFLRKQKIELRANIKLFFFEEILFLAGLLLWSYVRSFQPDIRDLEKFMDFGFINSILRSDYFPPKDMWLTPYPINYYYFGHLFTAVLTKISGIPSYISFNLMLATIFSFCFGASFSIGLNLLSLIKKISLKKSVILSLFVAYAVTLAGNLETIYAFFRGYSADSPQPFWKLTLSLNTFPNAYWYPNATRFIYHTIHEFPSYSFVVADLHGHVLDIPVVLILIALALLVFVGKKLTFPIFILISFLLAVSYMTNAWDGLIYLLLFSLIVIFKSLWEFGRRELKQTSIQSAKFISILFLGFFVFTLLFNINFSPFASGIGVNCSPAFLVQLQHFGPFLFESGQCQHSPWWQLLILWGFPLFMVSSFVLFLVKRKPLISDYFVLLISFFSIFLIIIPEFFYLKDIYTTYFRANTMFKLAYQAFIMLGLSSIYILVRIISARRQFKLLWQKVLLILFILGSFSLLFFVAIYPYFAVPSGYGGFSKYKGLKGTAYLQTLLPQDYLAINWINKNITGQPVILEAQGDSYTTYGRISSNTGLPTVLGWTVHEWLWRGSYDIPSSRFADISNLYETKSISLAKSIVKKYNVSYIYVGVMERNKYAVSEDKFTKLGKLVYSNQQTKIYKIN